MNYSKLGSVQAIAFIVIIILNHLVLNLPKNLISSCGSSTPLNIIYVSILVFIFLYFLVKLFKNFPNSDIVEISEFVGGKVLKTIIGILFICYFLIISSTQIRNFCEILKIVYFPEFPICLLIVIFLAVGVCANKFGLNTIFKANIIIVPLIMINLLIALFCVSSRFVPQRIFPIMGYGINETFLSGITNIYAFTGLSCIYFLQPLLDKKEDFKKISFISIGISSFYLFLCVISLLFSFSDILKINEISPIYLLIRGTDFGRFIQRPDSIFFLGWILSFMSYISIIILLITRIGKEIGNLNSSFPITYMVATIIFIVALIPKGMVEIRFIQNVIYKYFILILAFIIPIIILILANIKFRKTHKLVNKESDLKSE